MAEKERYWISPKRKRQISLNLYEINRRIFSVFRRKNPNKKLSKLKSKQTIFIVTMLAIPVAHFLVFWLYKNFSSILLAFKNIDFANDGKEYWTLSNFKAVFDMFSKGNLPLYGHNRQGYRKCLS